MASFLYLEGWTVTAVQPSSDTYVAEATYDLQPDACPKCGVVGELYRHGIKASEFRDAPVHGKQVIIQVQRRRYRCRACQATFLQPLPDMEEGRRMTVRCREYVAEQGLRRPFTQVADDLGLDEKTVRQICGERIERLNAEYKPRAPRVLGIDEVVLMSRACAVLTDSENGHVLDILDTRAKPVLAAWISHLPGRHRIEVVTIDMWRPYRELARALLPNAAVIVDKWHVLRMASEAMEKVRVASQRDLTPQARRLSKRGRTLLLARPHRLSPKGQLALDGWLANSPAVRAAHVAKEGFYSLWDIPARADAEKAYDAWKASLGPAEVKAFKPLLTAMGNWRDEVFAWWDHRVTNARTETLNGILKQVNRAGRGYSFEVLRARVIEMKGQPRAVEGQFRCDLCLGLYDLVMRETAHIIPIREGGQSSPDNQLQVCANCHRLHTRAWFTRHERSTLQSE